MPALPIVPYGNPILRKQAARIEEIDDDIVQLVGDMHETMDAAGGVGLAAPQVGQSLMLFLIDWGHLVEGGAVKAYINPELLDTNDQEESHDEGCLSFPGVNAEIYRPDQIKVRYQELDGAVVEEEIVDFPARVFQHEYDHLTGVLFIDRMEPPDRARLKPKLQAVLDGTVKPFNGVVKKEEAAA